jgi:hypothetical protein
VLLIFTRISSSAMAGAGMSSSANGHHTRAILQFIANSSAERRAPRLRRPGTSEHAIGVGGGDVRGEPGDRIFRTADQLQHVPVLDRLSVGVHLEDVDAPAMPVSFGSSVVRLRKFTCVQT